VFSTTGLLIDAADTPVVAAFIAARPEFLLIRYADGPRHSQSVPLDRILTITETHRHDVALVRPLDRTDEFSNAASTSLLKGDSSRCFSRRPPCGSTLA